MMHLKKTLSCPVFTHRPPFPNRERYQLGYGYSVVGLCKKILVLNVPRLSLGHTI